jgi:hypothetical protein
MSDDDHIDDVDLDPTIEPQSSRAWLAAIKDAETAFEAYQSHADNIDKLFADLERLANDSRDREFQIFWANIQVLGPSVYARPPVPVIVPRFKDRRPVYRVSSELLERSTVVAFELADINAVMLQIRDDLNIVARGAAWVRYETRGESRTESERVCFEHLDRKDFLHEPARKWAEVGWVARRGWMTRKEMRKRFGRTSGKAYQDAVFAVRKDDRDNGAADNRKKAGVWEIWSKTEDRVVWVTEGVDALLDDGKPHLTLEGFFPCPQPAYGTVQRRSLVPVPDYALYKDQVEEANHLTSRIHAIADAIQARGFYPAGNTEMGDAIEAAIKTVDDRRVLIPISNWAAFGPGGTGDPIVWLPIEALANTVTGLVALRRQVIDDIYQIVGLSDIMRGSTEKEETATAQQIKAQFGGVRVRDKQAELIRVARDMVRIGAEIMAENFSPKTLLEMSQMEIETDADIKRKVEEVAARAEEEFKAKFEQARSDPKLMEAAQQNPQAAQQKVMELRQQITVQAQEAIDKLNETPTLEKVTAFLRDQRIRPFVLDIETDSTIAPDEQAEKEARAEFLAALGGMIQQFGPVLAATPEMAPVVGELIKFALAPFRAGRELEGKIDEAIDALVAKSRQPRPDPEAEKLKGEMAMRQQEMQGKAQIEMAKLQADQQGRQVDAQLKQQENEAKLQQIEAKMQQDRERHQMEMERLRLEMAALQQKVAADMQMAQIKQQTIVQQADIAARSADQQAAQADQAFQQKAALAEQAATHKMQQGPV